MSRTEEECANSVLSNQVSLRSDTKANHRRSRERESIKVDHANRGFPNFLTPEEQSTFDQFSQKVKQHGDEWIDTIFCFGRNEREEYAYCRWLRARKFSLEATISMIQEATRLRSEAKIHNFYPDATDALGVEESIFKTQYPQLFYSHAKNGCPLYIMRPGAIQMNGLQCITTIDNMNKYQWNCMIHAYGKVFKARQEADSTFTRFQSVVISDLHGISASLLTDRKVLQLFKHQSAVDSFCFPEVMNRMIVINAPTIFPATWNVIKRWIDPRTQAKIEIYSSKAYWGKRLLELIDKDKLPSEYGGSGPTIENAILSHNPKENISRRVTELMNLKSSSSRCTTIELSDDESLDVTVFTKSLVGAEFYVSVYEDGVILGKASVQAESTSDPSISDSDDEKNDAVILGRQMIAERIVGPGKFNIQGNLKRSRSALSKEYFLVVMNVTKIALNKKELSPNECQRAHTKSIRPVSRHLIYVKENGWVGTF